MNIDNWKTQLRKGTAEFVILATLAREPASGTALVQGLARHDALGLSEGTVYPLLARLEREGRISGTWDLPTGTGAGAGRPTKSYRLTPDGHATLSAMRAVWTDFRTQLSSLTGDLP